MNFSNHRWPYDFDLPLDQIYTFLFQAMVVSVIP